MSEETTQLFIHCHWLDQETEQRIANLMNEYGFPITSTEGKTGEKNTLMTNSFVNDGQNQDNIDFLFEKIENRFEDVNVSRHIGEGAGYQHLPFDWIYEFLIRDEGWVEEQKGRRKPYTDLDLDFANGPSEE